RDHGQRCGRGSDRRRPGLDRRVHALRPRTRLEHEARTGLEKGGLMLLAVDIGNTETTIGVFEGEELAQTWRIATQAERTSDELALVIMSLLRLGRVPRDADISGVAVSSVVPNATHAMREMVPQYFDFEPVIVEPGIRTGMPIRTDNPKE